MDGAKLVQSTQSSSTFADKERRQVPQPPAPLPLRLRIIDQEDEENRSRVIQGRVLDTGQQGMRIQTGTIETGELNIIRDHTIAFKNKLDLEVDLPEQTIRLLGYAAWYKPAEDGINWNVGIYIRDMSAADRRAYDAYLASLANPADGERATSNV